MQTLRRARSLARFVLAWFAFTLGVAIASPLVNPQTTTIVCSAGGVVKVVDLGSDGTVPSGHELHCPLCMVAGAPPPARIAPAALPQPLTHVLRPVVASHIAGPAAALLPARGPPAVSA